MRRPEDNRAKGWSGACRGSGATCTVTLEASKTARVTFEKPQVGKRCTAPKPKTAQTLQGSERGTDVEGNAQRGKTRTVSQPQTRPVTCNSSTSHLWALAAPTVLAALDRIRAAAGLTNPK